MKCAYPAFRSQGSFHSPGQRAMVPFAVGLPRHRVPCAQTRFIHSSDRSNADIDLELGSPAGLATPPALRNPHCPCPEGAALTAQLPGTEDLRGGEPQRLKCRLSANTSTLPTVTLQARFKRGLVAQRGREGIWRPEDVGLDPGSSTY